MGTPGNRRRQNRAQMDHRPFASGACARAERQGGDEGRQQAFTKPKFTPRQCTRLDHVGHGAGAPGFQARKQDADEKPAHHRPGHDPVPGQGKSRGKNALGSRAKPEELEKADQLTKGDGGNRDCEAEKQRQEPDQR